MDHHYCYIMLSYIQILYYIPSLKLLFVNLPSISGEAIKNDYIIPHSAAGSLAD